MAPEIQAELSVLLLALLKIGISVIVALATAAGAWAVVKINEVRQRIGDNKYWILRDLVEFAVREVAQTMDTADNRAKLEAAVDKVLSLAQNKNIFVTKEMVTTLIEATVNRLNEQKNTTSTESTSTDGNVTSSTTTVSL